MKFLNLRKLKDIALAVLCAAAVLFVMPVTVFADDDNVDYIVADTDSADNINGEEIVSDVDSASAENEGSEISDPSSLDDVPPCYGICCDECDETCDGTCCEFCDIISDKTVIDNGVVDGEAADNQAEGEGSGNSDSGAAGNVTPAIPVFPSETDYPDNSDYTNIFENTEYPYQPVYPPVTEVGTTEEEWFDDDFDDGTGVELTEGDEIIYDYEEELPEEIVLDEDLIDDEYPDESDGEVLEELTELPEEEENQDNSDEDTDESTDDEDLDSSDDENTEDPAENENSDDPDGEATEAPTDDEDNSDSEDADNAADEEESEDLEEFENPIINVVLPASISVAVNPYNLKTDNENGDFYYSILSPDYTIKNYSNCDISIAATVSASTTGGVVLSPYNLNGDETEFTAFVYLEAINEGGTYSDDYYDNANQLAFANSAVSKEILLLADGSNGETTGYFKINGLSVIPDDVYFSSQAMINMVITFDIVPVGKSAVSDAEDSETSDPLDGEAVDEPTEDETGNSNDEPADNPAEDETGNPNDEASDNSGEDETGNPNDEPADNSAEDEIGNPNDEAVDNSAEYEVGNPNDEAAGNQTEGVVDNPNDEIIDDTIVDSGIIYDDAEGENIQEIIV